MAQRQEICFGFGVMSYNISLVNLCLMPPGKLPFPRGRSCLTDARRCMPVVCELVAHDLVMPACPARTEVRP